MTKAPKRPRDLNQWAKRMVDIATGGGETAPETLERPNKAAPTKKSKSAGRPASAKKA